MKAQYFILPCAVHLSAAAEPLKSDYALAVAKESFSGTLAFEI